MTHRSRLTLAFLLMLMSVLPPLVSSEPPKTVHADSKDILRIGSALPDAMLVGADGKPVRLSETKGRARIISVVPQLNTPVCDEQTHHFSEQNGGLDRQVKLLTLSTNTAEDQTRFARKARISNITFLSDAPAHEFGKQTGLLLPMYGILHRAVIVADAQNSIRYVEMVPMGQLPNFDAAYAAARAVIGVKQGCHALYSELSRNPGGCHSGRKGRLSLLHRRPSVGAHART